MKAHHSECRDHHSFARAGIPSLARVFTADCKLAKAGDRNRFACLKGRLEEFRDTLQRLGCLRLRDFAC